ncbi:RlmE family RNA methyltransferase [Methylopila turkensis]|uniref:RlmE family RNA methyltransferase n=1 Tax=Methylopila turkensis TaxID=1437816 RepID=UPI003D174043
MSRGPAKGGGGAGKGKGAGAGGSGRGARSLGVRVYTARKRSHASTLWLERQLNDPYVQAAKREGYRSRAAFKLIEIDDRHKLLKPGQKIVDLGAAPGGWSQIAARRIDVEKGRGKIVAIDLLEMEPLPGVDFMVLDFLDDAAPDLIRQRLGGKADLVLSDMAANTIGHQKTDHLRIVALVEAAALFASEVLAPGGAFLAKVFQGGTEGELLAALKRDFSKVIHVKPPSSRKDSAELYVLATGFRGEGVRADGSNERSAEGGPSAAAT